MPLTAPYTGRRAAIGLGKESTRGTGVAASQWLPYASMSYFEKVTKVRDDSGFGNIESVIGADIVKKWNEGEIEFNIRDQSIGLILLSLFGTETFTTNQPTTGAGRHVFSVAQSNQHQSLSIVRKTPVETQRSVNAVITTLSLRAVLDQYVRVTAGFIGKAFGSHTDTVSYTTTENKFRPQDAVIKLATNIAGLGAASPLTTVRSLTLNINTNAEDYQGLGSVEPVDFINRDFTVTVDFELALENTTYKDLTLNNTFQAMSIAFINDNNSIGASSDPKLEFQLDEVDFEPFDVDEANENVAILTAHGVAHYNFTNSSMIQATLENGKNTAY